jgi:tRNA-specific 2-thiouridylase
LEAVTFTVAPPDTPTFRAEGRIRYHAPLVEIEVGGVGQETSPNTNIWVTFTEPQYGVSSGQSLVFYRGEEVLGGGIIKA